jgi:outer membrane protein assembly factor BamB
MKMISVAFILATIFTPVCFAQQVSEWREEDRTGVSSETGLMKSWPDAGPKLLWSNLELPKGFSSVSFGDNTIYITGTLGTYDNLVAMNMHGEILWQKVMGRSWTGAYPDSRATPTVGDNMVYTCSGFGDLACFDGTSGEIIWSYRASEMNEGTYGSWGIAESLIIDGDQLYFSPGGPETMTIALDRRNGEVIWKSESLNDKPGYVSPILREYAGRKMLINVSLGHVYAIDVSNGIILWKIAHQRHGGGDLIKCVTPLFHNGEVYVTGGYNTGGMLIRIADDGLSADVVWTDDVLDVHHGGVVLINGYIYGSNWLSNSNGNWCCIEWETGKKMWEEHWKCKGSIIAAGGMLYIYEEKRGNVGLLKATPEKFDLISSFRVTEGRPGPYWAHPVIHNGILYIRHTNALMAYDIHR